MTTIKIRGTSRNGDTVASGDDREGIDRQIRRAYGRSAFLQRGNTVLGSGMREGMILKRVGRGDDYTVLDQVIVYMQDDAA